LEQNKLITRKNLNSFGTKEKGKKKTGGKYFGRTWLIVLEKEKCAEAKNKFGKSRRKTDGKKYSSRNQKKEEATTDYRKHT
jgi:hypothetical protein